MFTSLIVIFSFLFVSSFLFVLIENPKIVVYLILLLVYILFLVSLVLLVFTHTRKPKNLGTMAKKKLGYFATPNDDYLRAPITQPAVEVETYEIKPNFLTLV